jgi:hypothetical protein
MSSKAFAVRSALGVPERWANGCQISGRSLSVRVAIRRGNRSSRRGLNILRKFVILICVAVMPCVAFARTDQTSWENLGALGAGQKIQILELNSKKVSGSFLNFSSTNISLQAPSGEQIILRQDVRSVTLMENHHRFRNTLIGAAVGVGAGAGIGAAAYHPCTSSAGLGCIGYTGRGIPVGIGAVVGGVGGAIVGAVWPSHKTIFRAAGQ